MNELAGWIPSAGALPPVSQTMLVPLAFKALEAEARRPMVVDRTSARIAEELGVDLSRYSSQRLSRAFALMRARQFDRYAEDFLRRHPKAVVVELGCGLDDRAARIRGNWGSWINVDLPQVVDIRRRFIPERERSRNVAVSILDPGWITEVERDPQAAYLLLAEGVFPYLEKEGVMKLFGGLAARFSGSGCELVFDALSTYMVQLQKKRSSPEAAVHQIRWTVDDDREMEAWGSGLHLLESWGYFQRWEPRLGVANLIRLYRPMATGTRVLRYQIGEPWT